MENTCLELADETRAQLELFPELIDRMRKLQVVMLLFTSGKLVCTGPKHEVMVKDDVEKLHETFQVYNLIYNE